jgi:hypothetical protein
MQTFEETVEAGMLTQGDGWPEAEPETIVEAPRGPEEVHMSTGVVTISQEPGQGGPAEEPLHAAESLSAVPPKRIRPTIPRKYIAQVKGKEHVRFVGLVVAAQDDGLLSLKAEWTYNDAELSLAHAVAIFADGRHYEDSGDATPANVESFVKPHFRRMALTRAQARCLRTALGIEECSREELADEEDDRPVPDMTGTRPTPAPPHPKEQIRVLLEQLGHRVTGQRQAQQLIKEQTGYDFTEENYTMIIPKLKALVAAPRN